MKRRVGSLSGPPTSEEQQREGNQEQARTGMRLDIYAAFPPAAPGSAVASSPFAGEGDRPSLIIRVPTGADRRAPPLAACGAGRRHRGPSDSIAAGAVVTPGCEADQRLRMFANAITSPHDRKSTPLHEWAERTNFAPGSTGTSADAPAAAAALQTATEMHSHQCWISDVRHTVKANMRLITHTAEYRCRRRVPAASASGGDPCWTGR